MASENKDEMAGEDFSARLRSLITRFGFRPDEVSVSGRFGVGTISFKNQKGKATELVSKLRGAMKQMGVPEAAITAREVQYPADEDGPAEHWGVVNVDFNKMPHAKSGKKDTMAVEDRFYFGKGRKERFGYNWWSQQQQELVPAALRASSSARMAAADLQRLATRLEAQGKFLKGVKQQDLTGTNQKLYDAVYQIIADVQKVKDLLGE